MTHQLRHSTLFFLLSGLGLLTILLLAAHAALNLRKQRHSKGRAGYDW